MTRLLVLASVLGGAMLASGCAEPEYVVTGNVTLNSKPLKTGDIAFYPPQAGIRPVSGTVADGKFEVKLKARTYKVEIRVLEAIPASQRGTGTYDPTSKESLPERYNSQSTLKADITADSPRELTFELKSP